jgi:hypothetical protein
MLFGLTLDIPGSGSSEAVEHTPSDIGLAKVFSIMHPIDKPDAHSGLPAAPCHVNRRPMAQTSLNPS